VLNLEGCSWKTKTPFASIRRIVQDERFFFKIRPGLWALKSYKEKLPPEIFPEESQPKAKQEEYNHTYYQGLITEIGNLRKFNTFIPNQDKNRLFLNKKLCEISTLNEIYKFSYDHIVRKVQTIDVTWFNVRKMPANCFEVEHSADIYNSLIKFCELQDFHTAFCIVADAVRRNEFKEKLASEAFKPINQRVMFWSYEDVAELHSKISEFCSIQTKLNL